LHFAQGRPPIMFAEKSSDDLEKGMMLTLLKTGTLLSAVVTDHDNPIMRPTILGR
jgi:hypothetical protein